MAGPGATLQTAAAAALERAVNRALSLDPRGAARLARLEGETFGFACRKPELNLYLRPVPGGVRVSGHWEGPVTAAVAGEAGDFAALAASGDPAAQLINGAVELEGDSGPLLELRDILAGLEMDWEAPLVAVCGDVLGHQLAQGLRGALGWSRRAAASARRQVREFIHEEARLAPPRLEVEDFCREVRALSLRAERLESRARKLARALGRRP